MILEEQPLTQNPCCKLCDQRQIQKVKCFSCSRSVLLSDAIHEQKCNVYYCKKEFINQKVDKELDIIRLKCGHYKYKRFIDDFMKDNCQGCARSLVSKLSRSSKMRFCWYCRKKQTEKSKELILKEKRENLRNKRSKRNERSQKPKKRQICLECNKISKKLCQKKKWCTTHNGTCFSCKKCAKKFSDNFVICKICSRLVQKQEAYYDIHCNDYLCRNQFLQCEFDKGQVLMVCGHKQIANHIMTFMEDSCFSCGRKTQKSQYFPNYCHFCRLGEKQVISKSQKEQDVNVKQNNFQIRPSYEKELLRIISNFDNDEMQFKRQTNNQNTRQPCGLKRRKISPSNSRSQSISPRKPEKDSYSRSISASSRSSVEWGRYRSPSHSQISSRQMNQDGRRRRTNRQFSNSDSESERRQEKKNIRDQREQLTKNHRILVKEQYNLFIEKKKFEEDKKKIKTEKKQLQDKQIELSQQRQKIITQQHQTQIQKKQIQLNLSKFQTQKTIIQSQNTKYKLLLTAHHKVLRLLLTKITKQNQCMICFQQYDSTERQAVTLCSNQHTSCKRCKSNILRIKICPFCRRPPLDRTQDTINRDKMFLLEMRGILGEREREMSLGRQASRQIGNGQQRLLQINEADLTFIL